MDEINTISKSQNKINYKIIAIIGILSSIDIVYNVYFFDGSTFSIKDGLYLTGIASCGIMSILIAKKYRGSVMLTKAYFFLGLGFFAWFISDVEYYYAEFVLEIHPWPSPFDIGYIASYVFAGLHLVLNIKYFKPEWTKQMKTILVVIPIGAVSIFTITAYVVWGEYEELAFDLFYSNLFVIGPALIGAFAIMGASVFRTSVLKSTWLLLLIGILFWAMADLAYIFLETINAYEHSNVQFFDTLWMTSFMLIFYALYKHQKVL